MSKKNDLMSNMKGGIDALISSTAASEPVKKTKATKVVAEQPEEKEAEVHCNIVIRKSIHTRMKYVALDQDTSLKECINNAMLEYLEKYEKKR